MNLSEDELVAMAIAESKHGAKELGLEWKDRDLTFLDSMGGGARVRERRRKTKSREEKRREEKRREQKRREVGFSGLTFSCQDFDALLNESGLVRTRITSDGLCQYHAFRVAGMAAGLPVPAESMQLRAQVQDKLRDLIFTLQPYQPKGATTCPPYLS